MEIKFFIKMIVILFALMGISLTLRSCYKEEVVFPGDGLADWGYETHSGEASPDCGKVFPQDKVNRIDMVIDSEDWENMLQDLESNLGEFGTGGHPPQPTMLQQSDFGFFNQPPPPPPQGDFTPIYSKASIFFNGIEWYYVGVRFKGNSSLGIPWQAGIMKPSFRLNFDKYENDYPEVMNQRFNGFKELSLSNNFEDKSFLYEKVTSEIFRNAGLKAPQTAYYAIYIDYGDGPTYFGLYTGVEIIEDTMLNNQFGSDDGNCYKPEGDAATFAIGTFNEAEFDLKTNQGVSDYSDVKAF